MELGSYLQPEPQELFVKHLNNNIRGDKRELFQCRQIGLVTGSILAANGSAKASVGQTEVICGIKAELTKPPPAEPKKGFIVCNVDLPPLCSPKFKPGPPSDQAQVATVFLDNLIKSSNLIDLEELSIEVDKLSWVLYCDLICINYDGNLLDTCVLALLAALQNTRLPIVTMNTEEVVCTNVEESRKLTINRYPTSCTFAYLNDRIICDPTLLEEDLTSGTLTIVTDEQDKLICIEKPGGDAVTPTQLSSCIEEAVKHGSLLRKKFFQTT